LLTFDQRFEDGVPHDKTEIVHGFVVTKFQEYIRNHPEELRVVREPKRDLTGKPIPPDVRVLTPSDWVRERTAAAEELLWRKTCKQCHAYAPQGQTVEMTTRYGTEQAALPRISEARATSRWLPHAKFDHDAHRGFSCVGCHAQALTSTETSDVLVPGIANCKTCHAPGADHAESRCFECHTYHDWGKRKEMKATFTLPALEHGGR
jgi:transcription elongation factor Elf1